MGNNLIAISGKINSGKDTVGKIIQYLTLDKEVFAMTNADIIADLEYNGYCANKSDWKIKKFADKLKDIVCILIGCTREQLEDREFKEKELGEEWDKLKVKYSDGYDEVEEIFPLDYNFSTLLDAKGRQAYIHSKEVIKLTPRKLLQLLGTEAGRNIIHPNIWVNALFSDYDKTKTCEFYHERKSCMCYRESDDSTLCENDYPNWIITDLRFPNELQAIKDRGGITIRVNRPKYAYESDLPAESSPLQHAERGKELHNHFSETALDDAEFDFVIDNNSSIEDLTQEVKDVLIKLNLVS